MKTRMTGVGAKLRLLLGVTWGICLAAGPANADYPVQFGGNGEDLVLDMAVDPDGNSYVVGTFEGRATFGKDAATVELNSAGDRDIFVAKYDPEANLIWVRQAGGIGIDVANAIVVDEVGNAYIGGTSWKKSTCTNVYDCPETTYFYRDDKRADVADQLPAVIGEHRPFVARLDTDGGWRWAEKINPRAIVSGTILNPAITPTTNPATLTDLALAKDGSGLYVTSGEVTSVWNELNGTMGSALGLKSAMVQKLDLQGAVRWVFPSPIDSLTTNDAAGPFRFSKITAGEDGRMYAVVVTDWVSGSEPLIHCGVFDAADKNQYHLVGLQEHPEERDANGNLTRAERASCEWLNKNIAPAEPATETQPLFWLRTAPDIAVDGDDLYTAFQGEVDRYDPDNGNRVNGAPAPALTGLEFTVGGSLAVDEDGVYLAGGLRGAGTVGFGSYQLDVAGALDGSTDTAYVAKLTRNLNAWGWARSIDRSTQGEGARAVSARIAVDEAGLIHLAGDFHGEMSILDATLLSQNYGFAELNPNDALNFDGVDHVLRADPALMDGLTDFTVEMWLRQPLIPYDVSDSAGPTPISAANSSTSNEFFFRFTRGSQGRRFGLMLKGQLQTRPMGSVVLDDGLWHHVAVVRDAAAGTLTLYKDGYFVTTATGLPTGALAIDPNGLVIGQEQDSVGGGFVQSEAFKGDMDEVRIWGVARSAQEIAQNWQAEMAAPYQPGLRAYYQVDKGAFNSGPTLVDEAGAYSIDLGIVPYESPTLAGGPRELQLLPEHIPAETVRVVSGQGPSDGYLAALDVFGGNWVAPQVWVLGSTVTPPDGALPLQPDIRIEGLSSGDSVGNYFYWNENEQKLYVIGIAPGEVTISWKVSEDVIDQSRIVQIGETLVPPPEGGFNTEGALVQYHVAGIPVPLEPATAPDDNSPLRLLGVAYPRAEAGTVQTVAGVGPVFNRQRPVAGQSEFVVLQYVKVATPDSQPDPSAPPVFVMVYTVDWSDAPDKAELPWDIGTEITDGRHEAGPDGENGYVLYAKSRHDGTGVDAAYDRDSRQGQIFAVNEEGPDPLIVVWSRTNPLGVRWPDLPVHYQATWPAGTPAILISDQSGAGPLDGGVHANARVYVQNDPVQAGFNPNEEHARLVPDGTGFVVQALRNDLNTTTTSKPYVLVKYQDAPDHWSFKAFKVEAPALMSRFGPDPENDPDVIARYQAVAGNYLPRPKPMSGLLNCAESGPVEGGDPAGVLFPDVKGDFWAASSNEGQDLTVVRYHYPLQPGFYMPADAEGNVPGVGTCIPWQIKLDGAAQAAEVDVSFATVWPADADVPVLDRGESLLRPKRELPEIMGQAAVQIVFDQGEHDAGNSSASLVRLFDPVSERRVALPELPDGVSTYNDKGKLFFSDLPFVLRSRLFYDPVNKQLGFAGFLDEDVGGDPHLLPNIMTSVERQAMRDRLACSGNALCTALDSLYHLSRNPNQVYLDYDQNDPNEAPDKAYLVGMTQDAQGGPIRPETLVGGSLPKVLSAGLASKEGYVTLAFNNFPGLGSPVQLKVLKVGCGLYRGNVWEVPSDNLFEEDQTLRHTGDFAGDPDNIEFEWYYQPDSDGQNPGGPLNDPPQLPWTPLATAAKGALDITIKASGSNGLLILQDKWVVARYKGLAGNCPGESATTPSPWAGDPASAASTLAFAAPGWIKRVVAELNPFDQRFNNFHDGEINTLTSMLAQAGEPYTGEIAFNPDPNYINQLGLIEAYQTVLNRGLSLSVVQGHDDPAANNALLNAATRIADMYHMLGNEAFADAADPTIGFDTGSELGSLASSIFAFENQLASPLEEELSLLRGRDDSHGGVGGAPVFNRLYWNFTQGDGEVAYVQTYNIEDQNKDEETDERDARILYPQGHGDAWGHYLTSVKSRYQLLREPKFTWIPRAEAVNVNGTAVQVDYLDERKFARAAAAKARTGGQITNLTYRQEYVEDPAGQWQGYKDTDADRAWGMDGWGRRAGQGAYFDWLVANAILPAEDTNPEHTGIEKVDRTTVAELAEISAGFSEIQAQMDKADAGLNPIGVAKGSVPFDIDPSILQTGSNVQGKTHFEQIAERAQQALDNAVRVFDHASQQSQALRNVQDDIDALRNSVIQQERGYRNQLIEIFGYPYAGDIGAGKLYPSGYNGPDIYHYMYVSTGLTGTLPTPDESFTGGFGPVSFGEEGLSHYFPEDVVESTGAAVLFPKETTNLEPLKVDYPIARGADWKFVASSEMGERRAPGELQNVLSDLLQAQTRLNLALTSHQNLIARVEDARDLLLAEQFNNDKTLQILEETKNSVRDFNAGIAAAQTAGIVAKRIASTIEQFARTTIDSFPKVVGISVDFFAPVRGSLGFAAQAFTTGFTLAGDAADITAIGLETAKSNVESAQDYRLFAETNNIDLLLRIKELEQLWREEAVLRLELLTQAEVVKQTFGRYLETLARGERLLEERLAFRISTASDVQDHRYRDMTFRIFRNDALEKYRAQFELAARYVYLAATAYDYETNLLGGDNGAGRDLLADIVRQRSLGQVIGGVPVAGTPGLADVLARLSQNFDVYKGQLGFNNPQVETNAFSLRTELFRIRQDEEYDEAWRQTLERARVDNLWDIPEFRRYARPFAPESLGPQPGLVLRFPTTVNFGLNYFGHALGGGDSAYDSTNFATKIRAVGTWFSKYNGSGLSNTPRIYLIPVGMDVLRSPTGDTLATREWRVVDQKLPAPFPLGASDLTDPEWIPINDSLSDTFADIRRFSSFRAYHDSGGFDPAETISDSRLVGRSVWNSDWMLIIPGGTLLFNPDQGLDQFIHGSLKPGSTTERDGQGISDIKLNFQTYGYSGN